MMMNNILFSSSTLFLLFLAFLVQVHGDLGVSVQLGDDTITCDIKTSHCFNKKMKCPKQCPSKNPKNPKDKACHFNNKSPICQAECKDKKPNCNGPGAACHDPRFIGGDGIVFYFHGKSNQHFTLVSDPSLHINARFIGIRPIGRQRDFTWIQALGILFGTHTFSIEATKAAKWDQEVDHLRFFYDDSELVVPEGYPSLWASSSDDCFAHLEVQFQFYDLSKNVEGILGRTYQPDFVNPAKPGVAMAVVGGEDKYRTTSLLAPDCAHCMFSLGGDLNEEVSNILNERVHGTIDCTSGSNSGIGILCRK